MRMCGAYGDAVLCESVRPVVSSCVDRHGNDLARVVVVPAMHRRTKRNAIELRSELRTK